jgi:hypothetical protein
MNIQRKNQLQRISNIIFCLQVKPMNKEELKDKLFEKFQICFSNSQIEKDLFCLKNDFDAPIEYNKLMKKYVLIEHYDFKEALYNYVTL